MKILLLSISVLFLLTPMQTSAQDRVDAIHLNGGAILRGIIIENVPNDYVIIEITADSTIRVNYSEILKFTKEKVGPTNSFPDTTPGRGDSLQNIARALKYQDGKKSPGTALALSLLVTSAGHAYAGNWGRGLIFTFGRVGGLILVLNNLEEDTRYYYRTSERNETLFYAGIASIFLFGIMEAIDAAGEATRYNERLYKRIMARNGVSFDFFPGQQGSTFTVRYSF